MINKKILFRADGNSKIGLGHLFRIFSLVEVYKDSHECTILTKEDSTLNIIPNKYNLSILPKEIAIEEEVKWLTTKYNSHEFIIILDGYHFTRKYQQKLKECGFFLIYIDDLAKEYMYADIVINHSPHAKKSDFNSEAYTKFALGTNYAMIRPLFLQAAKEKIQPNKIATINKAFVCFGGADFYDLTFKATKALLKINDFTEINVVLGGAYKHKKILTIDNKKIKIHTNLNEKNIIQLMKKCNFAIVPSSTILYELSCIKMTILSGYYIDNQIGIYKGFLENNLIYGAENFIQLDIIDIYKKIKLILKDKYDSRIIKVHQQQLMFMGNQQKKLEELINNL